MVKSRGIIRKAPDGQQEEEHYSSVSDAAKSNVAKKDSIHTCRKYIRLACEDRTLYKGFSWQYAGAANEPHNPVPPPPPVQPGIMGFEEHVWCSSNTCVHLSLLKCQSLEAVCELVSSKIGAAAGKRDEGRMRKLWDPWGDGDCFFACIFAAFFMTLVADPDLVYAADRGVWQVLGCKHMRYLFLDYFKRNKDDAELMGRLGLGMMDADEEDAVPVDTCLERYARLKDCAGFEVEILCKLTRGLRIELHMQKKQYIQYSHDETEEKNSTTGFTIEDDFAIRLKKTGEWSNGHYKLYLF